MRKIEAHSYGCVMAELPERLAAKVMAFADLIPDEDIFDEDEKGRERQPHVTVKYGLHTDDPEEVRDVLSGQPPATVELGGMSAFHNEDCVVLKLDVRSDDLVRMNEVASEGLECADSFHEYHPHVTIAYLRHRDDDPYWYQKLYSRMFEGEEFELDSLLFSTADDDDYQVALTGAKSKAASRVAMSEMVARNFLAAPHLMVDCDGEMQPVDMYIELYGTGRLERRYEKLLERYFKTTDKMEMMRKVMKMRVIPVQCPHGDLELVNKDSGKLVRRVALAECVARNEEEDISRNEKEFRRSVVKDVYDVVFKKGHDYCAIDPDGSIQCHDSLEIARRELDDYWWFKDVKMHRWNETRWKKVAEKLIEDGAIKKFKNGAIRELIEDISDFTVNGHSFMSYKGKYIDPYLKSKGVPDGQIQKFCEYFEKIM